MTFIVTFLIAVSILIIRSFWKAYKEPAAILGRQAANMNWVAVGQVKDSDGYNNVRYVRDGMEAVVSFQEGNVSLVHPINDTFNDSLYNANRKIKKIDTKVDDIDSDLEIYITELKASIEAINKAIAVINGNINGIENSVNGVSSKLESLSTQVSKIKKK